MIKRQAYFNQVIPLIDKNLIKVITGVRRSGKTVLLSQIQEYLLEHGRNKDQLVHISFESKKIISIRTATRCMNIFSPPAKT